MTEREGPGPIRVFFNRRWGAIKRMWCILKGTHLVSSADWGYGGAGIVDLYCPNCLKIVRRVPLDDFSSLDDLLYWLDVAHGKVTP